MDRPFPCPKCGQPLTPPMHAVSMQCPACKNFIIIPESAIVHPGDAGEPAAVRTDQEQALVDLLCAGNKIGAIKLYRQATGAGLKEAKDAIDQLELNRQLPNATAMLYAGRQPSLMAGGMDPEAVRDLILGVLVGRGKIAAIKRYRELTGADLKTAKDAVERIESSGYPAYSKGSPAVKRLALALAIGTTLLTFIRFVLFHFFR